MCGICGAIGFDNSGIINRMNGAMRHRGPDDSGVWNGPGVFLGHTRLAIVDVGHSGHQPMANEDRSIWITCNGEIYNFKELRAGLEKAGHKFTSASDAEVIIHLYEDHGEECLKFLRGMFSFALWDGPARKLFAARDRLGIKPFFYHHANEKFIFASEMKALLASGVVRRELDSAALERYFSCGSVGAPRSLVSGIFQLPAASCLVFKESRLVIKKYWEIDLNRITDKSRKEHAEDVMRLLDEAVRIRMAGEVPIGAFLSGGIDSSAVSALMQRHSSSPVKTFSVVFDEKEYDERAHSRDVAGYIGADHTQILLKESDILKEMDSIFGAMDQPSVDGFNSFIISKAVKEAGIKVALSGLGGDELFAGYGSFRSLPRASRALMAVSRLPLGARTALSNAAGIFPGGRRSSKIRFAFTRCRGLDDLYFVKRMVMLPDEVDSILAAGGMRGSGEDTGKAETNDPVNRLTFLELNNYLADTLLQDADRMGMANSIEIRVPFLDHMLVEKVFEIPGRMKVGGGSPKRMLAEALKGMLPGEIYRRRKMGFVLPFDRWLKKELRDYCAGKISRRNLRKIPVIDAAGAERMWTDFLNGRGPHNYSSILSVLSFINWHEANISV